MNILHTNVLSALMQQLPDPVVMNWLDAQPAGAIWISSITLFEARYGLILMPEIQRKTLFCNSALSNSYKPTWPIGWSCSMFVPLIWQPNWLLATNW